MLATIAKYALGVLILSVLTFFIYQLFPTEFSFYTTTDFRTNLNSLSSLTQSSYTLLSVWIEIALMFALIKAVIVCLIAGVSFKIVRMGIGAFSGGGAS